MKTEWRNDRLELLTKRSRVDWEEDKSKVVCKKDKEKRSVIER